VSERVAIASALHPFLTSKCFISCLIARTFMSLHGINILCMPAAASRRIKPGDVLLKVCVVFLLPRAMRCVTAFLTQTGGRH
jgi:stage V sporulation protein SpoVS